MITVPFLHAFKRERFPAELDRLLEEYAVQFLEHGREGFDEPHTRRVAYYAEKIAGAERQDVRVIKTAAWLHDIGYFEKFASGAAASYDAVRGEKDAHMAAGARLAETFLSRPDVSRFFTETQKERIIHLVRVHDRVGELTALDEIILMEADTLGAIDVEHVTPTFNYEDGMKYIAKSLRVNRRRKFRTREGKKDFYRLLPKFIAEIRSRKKE